MTSADADPPITPAEPDVPGGRVARTVARFDDLAELACERVRSPALDKVFYPLSAAADHSIMWHVLGTVRSGVARDRRWGRRFGTAMGAESFLTNVVVKSAFGRVRPARTAAEPLRYGVRQPITSAFPSGHAAAAFCAAVLLGRGTRAAPAWYALASLVAASRVYVRLHHASDVVAGAALGLALGTALRPYVGQPGK